MEEPDLEIKQGVPFRILVRVKKREGEELVPVDISGGLVHLQARPSVESSTVLLDLSSDEDEITIEEETGVFVIELSSEETSALDWSTPRAVYQCEVTPSGAEPIRILEGTVTLDREVVR